MRDMITEIKVGDGVIGLGGKTFGLRGRVDRLSSGYAFITWTHKPSDAGPIPLEAEFKYPIRISRLARVMKVKP